MASVMVQYGASSVPGPDGEHVRLWLSTYTVVWAVARVTEAARSAVAKPAESAAARNDRPAPMMERVGNMEPPESESAERERGREQRRAVVSVRHRRAPVAP